ncbi:hypothetical protein HPY42_02220 [Coprothermobacteraceae bacterium]|nr:hypothetical protein [Coprothermobacteraceae bacterium]
MEYRLIPQALHLSPNQNIALISVDALEEKEAYSFVVSLLNQVGKYGWILLVTEHPRHWREQVADKDIHQRVLVCRLAHLRNIKRSAIQRVFVIPSPRKLEEYLVEAYHLLPGGGKVEVILPFEEDAADRYVKRLIQASSRDKLPLLEKLGFSNPAVHVLRQGAQTLAVVTGTKSDALYTEDEELAY